IPLLQPRTPDRLYGSNPGGSGQSEPSTIRSRMESHVIRSRRRRQLSRAQPGRGAEKAGEAVRQRGVLGEGARRGAGVSIATVTRPLLRRWQSSVEDLDSQTRSRQRRLAHPAALRAAQRASYAAVAISTTASPRPMTVFIFALPGTLFASTTTISREPSAAS